MKLHWLTGRVVNFDAVSAGISLKNTVFAQTTPKGPISPDEIKGNHQHT